MPRFSYRALVEGGRMVEGQLTSRSRDRAIDVLHRRRLVPVAVEEVIAATGGTPLSALWPRGGDAGRRALLEFTRDFGVLLEAGVPVGRALAIVSETPSGESAPVARRLLVRVRGGASVAAAMQAERALFPEHYVGMVRAGEEGSSLGEVFARLTVMLERAEALRAQLRASLAYPALVLCLGVLTMVVMLVFVVPEFRPIFEQGEVPLSARILLGASAVATDAGWAIALGFLALLLTIRQATRSRTGRIALDRLALHLPAIGPLVVRMEAARFCRTLGTLVVNGVVLLEAARISAGVVSNRQLSAATHGFILGLTQGDDVVRAIGRAGWLPDRVHQAIAVGAESDRVGEMLVRVAELLEAESARTMQRLVGMVAPVSTMVLGGAIGFMIWSVFSTVLGSYSQALQ